MRNNFVFSRLCSAVKFLRLSESKRSQVTIFIILGLIVVVSFIIIFLFFNPPEIRMVDENNPQAFIESCTRETVEEAINLLSKRGGDINPVGSVVYDGENIAYLCYNEEFYESCINQRPLYVPEKKDDMFSDKEYLLILVRTRMPFGKYKGRLLIDLPEAYIVWFAQQGFPKGELGNMLECVYEIKLNGLEYLLNPLR